MRKSKAYILTCCIILFGLSVIGQNTQKLDSLWILYHQSSTDTTRIKLLSDIGYKYELFNMDRAFICYEIALKIADESLDGINPKGVVPSTSDYKLFKQKAGLGGSDFDDLINKIAGYDFKGAMALLDKIEKPINKQI